MCHTGTREKHKQILNTLKVIHADNTRCLLLPLVQWESHAGGHRSGVPEHPQANAPDALWPFTEFPGTPVSSRGQEDKPWVSTAAMQKREEEKHERRVYLVKKNR